MTCLCALPLVLQVWAHAAHMAPISRQQSTGKVCWCGRRWWWGGGPATGTDVPVKQVELATTRHPLGMLIKVKVLNICGNLHSPRPPPPFNSASCRQILRFPPQRPGMRRRRWVDARVYLVVREVIFRSCDLSACDGCCHSHRRGSAFSCLPPRCSFSRSQTLYNCVS